MKRFVGGFGGSPQQEASVDDCVGVPAVTLYVIFGSPSGAFRCTTLLPQRPTRERATLMSPGEIPVFWQNLDS